MDESSYEVYEEHMKLLEEQLVEVTIEKQNLMSELRDYKDRESIDKLKTEIDIERNRYHKLYEKYKHLQEDHNNQHIQSTENGHGWVDISIKKEHMKNKDRKKLTQSKMSSKFERVWTNMISSVYTFMDDFTEEAENTLGENNGDPLTVKQLKENINRFKSDLKPYLDTVKGIQEMVSWKTPSYTLLMLMIYLISVWYGCFVPVILFCLIFRMIISYLNHKGFTVNFNFFQPAKEPKPEEDNDLGLSDKFNLVIEVARKVQNWLGAAADSLEKINSLLTWKTPVTKKIFFGLCIGFIMFITTSVGDHSYIIGIFFGTKIFIINYIYNRYPRIQRKYDSVYKDWQGLPTEAQYEKTCVKSEINQYMLTETENGQKSDDSSESDNNVQIRDTDKEFCQLFSLPDSECPLSGWHGGKRCSLINKDKSILSAFKNGKIYLTRSFLCFERKKSPTKNNIVIPLADIISVSKAKPYSFLPGSGMSLEIKIIGDKVFTFGAIVNRDEAYDSLLQAGLDKELPWATGDTSEKRFSPTSSLRRRKSSTKSSNFTWASDYMDYDD